MSVTNVYACCWTGSLPRTSSHLKSSKRSRGLMLSSPTFSTSQEFSRRGRLSYSVGFLRSLHRETAQCWLPSGHFGTLNGRAFSKNVGYRASTRKSRIRSGAEGETAEDEAAEGVDGSSKSNCLYVKRTIHNGEVLESSGNVIVLGDVEPGGQVLAGGDVVVLGRLQGHVQAGRAGDVTSTIFATSMEPKEIRIGDGLLFCPDGNQTRIPQMAALSTNGSIKVFPAIEESGQEQRAPLDKAGMSPKVQIRQAEDSRNQSTAQVALITGIYISVAGMALLGFPKVLFGILFDLEGVKTGWVRVGATLAVVFGVYYIGTALGDMRGMHGAESFYLSTVVGRIFLFVSFSSLVLAGAVPAPLLLVGAVNLVGAMVMLRALLLKSPAQSSR